MKVADAVASFLESVGLTHVFGVSGGASLHLIHGVSDNGELKFIPTTTETTAGYAADAYARINGLGCAMATSGPGASNLVTAIATSYYDSVPVIYITGNCPTFRDSDKLGVRQYGFQEMDIVSMVKGITKYARKVISPRDIGNALKEAVREAISGRKGPVLIDIPDDIQRSDIEWEIFEDLEVRKLPEVTGFDMRLICALLRDSKRPVFIFGAGCDVASMWKFAFSCTIPFVRSWGAVDMVKGLFNMGCFGTHGSRAANLIVQNADLIVCVGCRLDTKATADPKTFGRKAKLVMVDIDPNEFHKFDHLDRPVLTKIFADSHSFLDAITKEPFISCLPSRDWLNYCSNLLNAFPTQPTWEGWNPYTALHHLGKEISEDAIIVSDTGNTLGWVMQAYPFKGERFIHAFNNTPMGYGIPAALGAALSSNATPVVLFTGDGSAMMSLAELATIAYHKLPVTVILLDNKGHGMCRQTQRQWLGGKYPSTSIEGGLAFPEDWGECLASLGFNVFDDPEQAVHFDGPAASVIKVPPEAHLIPQARFGQPIEDADPLLPWGEFTKHMIIDPLPRRHYE